MKRTGNLTAFSRRAALLGIAAAAIGTAAPAPAQDNFPNRQLRMLVPFPPGGSSDIVIRIAAEALSGEFKQQVLVVNMPGAAAAAAAQEALRAPRDGYTMIMASSSFVQNPFFAKDAGFDIVKDFIPLTQLIEGPEIIAVNNDVPTKWADFVKHWKDNQKTFNVATFGYGSEPQILTHQLSNILGIDPFYIPYPGGAQAYAAIIRGDAQMIISTLSPALPQIRAGKVKAVAVTSATRATQWLPDVPSLKELGIDYVQNIVFGLAVASGTPEPIVQRLNAALQKVMNTPEVRAKIEQNGLLVRTNTPAEYAAFLENERKALGASLAKKPLPESK